MQITIDENDLNVFHSNIEVRDSEMYSRMEQSDFADMIKQKLISQLINELKKNNYIEFTSQDNPSTFTKVYRARIVAVPRNTIANMRQKGAFKNKEI